MAKIKVLAVVPDKFGTGYFRSLKPHQKLAELYPYDFDVEIIDQKNINYPIDELKKFDIIHFSKSLLMKSEESAKIAEAVKSSGTKFVMDLDDYWEIARTHPLFYRFQNLGYKEMATGHLKLADYVTTTTENFAKEIRKFNKNVIVLPNSIDPQEGQWQPKPTTNSKRVRIMWGGGSGHNNDIAQFNGLTNRLKSDGLIDKIQLVLCGFDLRGVTDPNNNCWAEYERELTNNYSICSEEYKNYLLKFDKFNEYPDIENQPYRRVWSKPIGSYATNYNLADICLAPLENTKFNTMKSQLKIIEAGWFGKPIIASNILPYTEDIINAYEKGGNINTETGNGFLASDDKDFFKYIKLLVNNKEIRDKIGENIGKVVREQFSLDKTTKDRAEFYKRITNQ